MVSVVPDNLRQRIFEMSRAYDQEHKLRDSDIEEAARLIAAIEQRPQNTPQVGDFVICRGPEKVYESGHLEKLPGPEAFSNVCTEPYTPFVFMRLGVQEVYCDTSGGYWLSVRDPAELINKGRREKTFKTWGHCGPCGNGAFNFPAVVNVWEYQNEKIY